MNHQNNFATNLTSNTLAGATTTPLNSIPTIDAPFYLALDATNINGHYEIVSITSKSATNVNHAAATYAHTTAEEVRQVVPAVELDSFPSEKATGAEINTGTDNEKYLTSKAVADSYLNDFLRGDGWITVKQASWTYLSASTIYASGDVTGIYQKGDKIKFTQTTVKYMYIIGISAYDAGNNRTTLTVTGGTDYTVANAAITSPFYSKIENPQSFPAYFNYLPTYSASGSMTFTSVTTSEAKFKILGKTLFWFVDATGTTGGTASNEIRFTVPVASTLDRFSGYGYVYDGAVIPGVYLRDSSTVMGARKYTLANYALAASKQITGQGEYSI